MLMIPRGRFPWKGKVVVARLASTTRKCLRPAAGAAAAPHASPLAAPAHCVPSFSPRSLARRPRAPRLLIYFTMPQEDSGRGVVAWLRRWWRPLLGEVVATALLVLLGVASVVPVKHGEFAPLVHPAFAFGFMVLVNVEVFGPVSGAHMNPAVTLTALLDRRLPPLAAVAYVVAQVFGAALGFAALQAMAPLPFNGCTAPAPGVSVWAAVCVEALLTGTLALLCCAVWSAHDASGPDRSVPLKFGLTVAGLVYAGGAMTGASLNPARSLAPAMLQTFWKDHWVYWVGPLGGAALATALHRGLRAPPAPRRDVELPLHDKPDH
ncbi:aquaporin-like [Epargyreus clarus]|uniref:aquaporin-like n=1 Tax=Epargyreus clarus TaxID=520877 RepID=UPI003C2AE5CF